MRSNLFAKWHFLIAWTFISLSAIATPSFGQSTNTQQVFNTWITTLSAPGSGYTVTQGSTTFFTTCAPYFAAFSQCFGNNALTPYGLPQPPVESANYLPKYTQASSFMNGSADTFWQIAENEAIITIITIPPQASYFGFQSYMLERAGSAYTSPAPTANACSPGTPYPPMMPIYTEAADCNFIVFGGFNNAINNADVLNIAQLPQWNTYNDNPPPPAPQGTPVPTSFNTIAIVTTPNQTLANAIEGAFAGQPRWLFTEAMPAQVPASVSPPFPASPVSLNTCSTGVRTPCDVFVTLIRTTFPQNSSELTAWQRGNNVLVYRVTAPGLLVTPCLPSGGSMKCDTYTPTAVNSGVWSQGCNMNERSNFVSASCPNAPALDTDLAEIAKDLAQYWQSITGDTYGFVQASGTTTPVGNGGVGLCIIAGKDCSGPTQDNNFYRSLMAGTLKDQAPVIVVGVLHSTSAMDFTTPTPLNNADYTGISLADDSPMYTNEGLSDSANPNSQSEFTIPQPNRLLLGSAATVLQSMTVGSTNLYALLSPQAKADINNIYIHIFQRDDEQLACVKPTCSNTLADNTTFVNKATGAPVPQGLGSGNPAMSDGDPVLITERGYLLAPPNGFMPGPGIAQQYLTGANAQFLESPYIVCDLSGTMCPATPVQMQ